MLIPIVVGLILLVIYFFFQTPKKAKAKADADAAQSESPFAPTKNLPTAKSKLISRKELAKHSSKNSDQVYLAHRGKVYDVSSSENFKGEGSYSYLTGKDATLALAKMCDDEELFNEIVNIELTEEEKKSIEEWDKYFQGKYPQVGILEGKLIH